jgi:hypothetical protein
VMITGWISVIEYIDSDGEHRLAAFASDTPEWRISGMIHSASELLAQDTFYDEWEE